MNEHPTDQDRITNLERELEAFKQQTTRPPANRKAIIGFILSLASWAIFVLAIFAEIEANAGNHGSLDYRFVVGLLTGLSILGHFAGFGCSLIGFERAEKLKAGKGLAIAGAVISALFACFVSVASVWAGHANY